MQVMFFQKGDSAIEEMLRDKALEDKKREIEISRLYDKINGIKYESKISYC